MLLFSSVVGPIYRLIASLKWKKECPRFVTLWVELSRNVYTSQSSVKLFLKPFFKLQCPDQIFVLREGGGAAGLGNVIRFIEVINLLAP